MYLLWQRRGEGGGLRCITIILCLPSLSPSPSSPERGVILSCATSAAISLINASLSGQERERERDGWTEESESTQGERDGEILNTVQSRDGFRFLFSFFPRFTRPTTGATPMSVVVDGDNGRKVGSSGPALSVAGEQKDLVQITLDMGERMQCIHSFIRTRNKVAKDGTRSQGWN